MPALRRQQLRRFLVHLPPDDGGLVGDDGDEGGDGRDEGGDGNGRVGVRGGEQARLGEPYASVCCVYGLY